jgi:hypothetical protein
MTIKRIGVALAIAVPVVAAALSAVVTWTPPAHEVHAPEATAVEAHFFALGWVPMDGALPAPTMSVDQMRCEVRRSTSSSPCPDAATFARELWPGLAQTPMTLYVALAGPSVTSSDPSGFNVEYDRTSRTLFVHRYASQALFVPHLADETPGAGLQPNIELLVVSTSTIPSGTITVVEDDWIERLTGDQSSRRGILGKAAIS